MNPASVLTSLLKKGVIIAVEHDELVIDAPDGVLQADDVALLREHRNEVMSLVRHVQRQDQSQVPVARVSHGGAAQLSPIQQNVLLLESISPLACYGNIPLAFEIHGELDVHALEHAFRRVIDAHEILRTTYGPVGDETRQVIHESMPWSLSCLDLSHDDDVEGAREFALTRHEKSPFNLSKDPPVRALLVKLAQRRYTLSLVFHQIAMDGHSCELFLRYLGDAYASTSDDAVSSQSFDGHQYTDFVEWQRRFQQTPDFAESVRFWKQILDGAPELHGLPNDFLRPATQTFEGKTFETRFQREDYARIERFAREHHTSVFVVLQAAFALLIARYSDQEHLVIGTAVANRTRQEFFGVLGNLVNTAVLRFSVRGKGTFLELVEHAHEVIDLAMRHQHVPFNVIVDEVRPPRSMSHNPLVQLMLVMQEQEQTQLSLVGCSIQSTFRDPGTAKFDLALHVYKEGQGAALRWEFSTALFRPSTIETFARYFKDVLLRCIEQPARRLNEVPLEVSLPTPATAPLLRAVCIDELIDAQVRARPNAIAIRVGATALTYAQLEEQGSRLAQQLSSLRLADDCEFRVGVCMERSACLVVAFYAVLKAGGVYVPLDPSYPQARLDFMIKDAGLACLLCDEPSQSAIGKSGPSIQGLAIPVLEITALCAADALPVVHAPKTPSASAYVLYTSGSTGKPKGVLVSHQSLFHSLWANGELMKANVQDVMPCLGSQAFGISVLEMLVPLVNGASVRMLPRDDVRDLDRLIDSTQDATILHAVPSLMAKWLERVIERGGQPYEKLRLLLVGGESVPDELLRSIRQWRPDVELIELYGMTESAVVCSSYRPDSEYAAHHCIGTPHPTALFYVLNRDLQLQPPGVPGELHIGGACLATGYLNQPELTAERFIPDPFNAGQRIYKTGDRVRMLPDGKYEFLGRVDYQVSLRGVRIECGEIEALAMEHADVKKCVAHVVAIGKAELVLVAYYTTHVTPDDVDALNESVRKHLERFLPDYMRPSVYQYLTAWPLNPNGKVDRKALPIPSRTHVRSLPKTSTQIAIRDIWQELLQLDEVGVGANFFQLGGNSLLATKLINQVKKKFSIELPVTALFETPTIEQLSAVVDAKLQLQALCAVICDGGASIDARNEIVI